MQDSKGTLLLHLDSTAYHSLNQTGAFIWAALDRPCTVQGLLDLLDQEYGAGVVSEGDVLTYVDELVGRGLAELVDAGVVEARHGLVYLVVMGLSFVAMVPLVIVAEKKRKMKLMCLGAIATITLSLVGLGLAGSGLVALGAWLLAFFTAFNLLEATLPSMISKLAPAGAKGTAMGVYSTSQFLGAFLGGVMGGFLAQQFGLSAVFLGAALLGLGWFVLMLGMRAPRHLSSEVVALADEHESDTLDNLMARFAAVAGVEDVLVVPEERLAYLKVDRATLDTEALARLTRSSTQRS